MVSPHMVFHTSRHHAVGATTHNAHWLQLLDRTVYRLMNAYFEQAVDAGRRILMTDRGTLCGNAYLRVCAMQNAISGFAKCGIPPYYDDQLVTDENFEPSMVTERAQPEAESPTEQQAEELHDAEPNCKLKSSIMQSPLSCRLKSFLCHPYLLCKPGSLLCHSHSRLLSCNLR